MDMEAVKSNDNKPEVVSTKVKLVKTVSTENKAVAKEPEDTEAKSPSATAVGIKEIKSISESERIALRSKKFGNSNLLETRAKRFGMEDDDKVNNNNKVQSPLSTNETEKLKKRAERFGAVSEKLKKFDDQEKLSKRKERFGVSATVDSSGVIKTTTGGDEAKRRRLERFGNKT